MESISVYFYLKLLSGFSFGLEFVQDSGELLIEFFNLLF
jgi:hypothetical protein